MPEGGGTESGTDRPEKILETVLGCDRLAEIVRLWPEVGGSRRSDIRDDVRSAAGGSDPGD